MGFEDFERLVDAADLIDLLIVGTGNEISHLPDTFREPLEDAGIGVEHMASAQACRTYNVLVHERRAVVAALFLTR